MNPPTDAPVPPPAASPSRARAFTAVAVAVLVTGVIAGVIWKKSGSADAPATVIAPDVPRAEGRTIIFSPRFRERAGVKTEPVKRAPIVPVIKVTGTVTFDPEHVAAVGTRIRGLVRKLAKIEGDTVKAGELLAEIESAELGEAQASVAMLAAQKRAAELNATREKDLAGRGLSTRRESEVAEATLVEYRAMLSAAHQKVVALGGGGAGPLGMQALRAPLSGTVVDRYVSAGQSVDGNHMVFKIADLDHLWIELAVFERNLGAIRKGDAVEVHPMTDRSQAIAGHIAHVGDELDLETKSAAVRVKIDNTKRLLRPGQAVTASIRASGPTRSALLVPARAITYIDGKPTLFVAEGDDRVTPTTVALGADDGHEVEITDGLAEGASVVTDGVFALKSEFFR